MACAIVIIIILLLYTKHKYISQYLYCIEFGVAFLSGEVNLPKGSSTDRFDQHKVLDGGSFYCAV